MSEPLKPRIDFDGPLQAEKIPPLKSARAFDTLEADNFAPARLVTGEEEEGAAEAVVESVLRPKRSLWRRMVSAGLAIFGVSVVAQGVQWTANAWQTQDWIALGGCVAGALIVGAGVGSLATEWRRLWRLRQRAHERDEARDMLHSHAVGKAKAFCEKLAQQAGLPNSTTHRLLTTMQQLGFVRQVGELGHWAVGAHAFVVGSSFLQSRNLLAIVHPILRQLMEDSGETVNLAVLDQSDHQAIIIDQVQCTQLMRMSAPIGGKLPMHASGAGKAFLSQLSEEQVTSLLHRKGLHAYTHATLVSPLHLKEDLAQTRKRGYSFDDEEHALGLRCVAACIYDEHREPFAAISISGPISRMTDDRVTELGALVIKAAKEVTLAYGGVK